MSFGRGYRFSSEDPGFSSTSSRNSNSFPITNSRSLSNLYIMLQHSRLTINNPLTDPVTLPSNVDLDLKIPDFKYNFNVELEIVSKIHDEKKSEAEQRELEAWKALESKKNRKPTPKPTDTVDPHTLVDLNFESLSLSSIETPQPPTAVPTTPSGKSLPSPTVQPPPPYPSAQAMVTSRPSPPVAMKSPHEQFVSSPLSSSPIRTQVNVEERLCSRLVDKGFELSLVRMAIDVIGLSNEDKLLSFLTNFRKLEELPDKFSRSIIGQSLLLFDCDFAKSLELLKEITKLSSKGIQLEDMLMAMGEFDNNVKATSAFLVSFKALKELGFQEEKIKEALMMNGNDSDKALQYILENS